MKTLPIAIVAGVLIVGAVSADAQSRMAGRVFDVRGEVLGETVNNRTVRVVNVASNSCWSIGADKALAPAKRFARLSRCHPAP